MERVASPKKKLKSHGIDPTANINIRNSITCANVPESLFEATAVKKHFSKFGRVQKIRLFPKRHMCIIEYDQPLSAERAVLNAGAFDGFMFDVTRTKARVRKSKKEDDPDWVPDSDVEEELSAMSGTPIYRVPRQKSMEVSPPQQVQTVRRTFKSVPVRAKLPIREKKAVVSQPAVSTEMPVVVPTQASMSTAEAAGELHLLRSRVSLTPDEQWRTLDARDRILRAWGGAGSRVSVGGATIGTCPDMCPEKELLHRQAEHQTMTLETVPDSDGVMEPWRAVKQYSRSSADQEIPMCYELRPAPVLMRTCAYLLHEIADTTRQISLADWFHFMWDRLRGIRKDITQQALCCADSINLVEMCARFHAHCAARLADLEHTQFDQKLNTDNLTKCLQTLKHMYGDVGPELKSQEAEFRGYIALLNLGDANFWWEIKQLPLEMQKSEPITFAIKVFNALDNNNYVRFFRLVREQATYLQACILLRYFNDVRARALARIVRAYAARGGSKYPAEDFINILSFESIESLRSFITHYGLRFGRDETDLSIILDRHQFIEDSDPFPIARALRLIESKRQCTVGEVIAGGKLPFYSSNHNLYTSFQRDGKLKESALIAEEQGYNTMNDSNKDVKTLKSEIQRLAQGGRSNLSLDKVVESTQVQKPVFVKPDSRLFSPGKATKSLTSQVSDANAGKSFLFKPAIPVASSDIIKKSPDKIFQSNKNIFYFSKPQDSVDSSYLFIKKNTSNSLKSTTGNNVFAPKTSQEDGNMFIRKSNENTDPFPNLQSVFKKPDATNVFNVPEPGKSVFSRLGSESNNVDAKNIFSNMTQNSISTKSIFGKSNDEIAVTKNNPTSIFGNAVKSQEKETKNPSNVFGSFSKPTFPTNGLFSNAAQNEKLSKRTVTSNGDISPGSLFKNANEGKAYTILQSKNKAPSVADNIMNSINSGNAYDFNENEDEEDKIKMQRREEQKIQDDMERKIEEAVRQEEEKRRQEAEKRKQEELKKLEERRKMEEERKQEELKRQEELKKKLEEERIAELKRKSEEADRQFKERVDKESKEITNELEVEIRDEIIRGILVEETEMLNNLNAYAVTLSDEICKELCDEISSSEIKAEILWTNKLKRKWFQIWKNQFYRNFKRRRLLEDTPIWLPERTPVEEAARLRRKVEQSALKHMNAIHRGYKFTGELRQIPSPEPYNIVEIIRSPLLKRMKQINYPYDKCFFWKVTLISPGPIKWVGRKIEIEKWIIDAFSGKKSNAISDTLLRVEKQSWNHLMDFAISVTLTNPSSKSSCAEALEGTNALLFYVSDDDKDFMKTVEQTLKHKYPYQILPVTVIIPKIVDESKQKAWQQMFSHYVDKHIISSYKIYVLENQNISESLNITTKRALKWLAKKCPPNPPLEVDYLKSICQRYLGNEIWCRFKSEPDSRMATVLKDLSKLVKCYNIAVDKLTQVITNENLFNYAPFPLEFCEYLNHNSPYPKPYEFIPTNARNSDNISVIRDLMAKLKLPDPVSRFQPIDVGTMQGNIRKYCNQIGWFEDPEEVVCKVVARLPVQFCDLDMPCEQFSHCFEHYDLIDFLNVLIYEKICRLQHFDNRFAIYESSVLKEYKNMDWIYETEVLSSMKHKTLDDEDLDMYIEAKRRKIAFDSMECLALEDADCTIVDENIKAANESIIKYSHCKDAVKQLEEQIDLERKKSEELEKLIKSALADG